MPRTARAAADMAPGFPLYADPRGEAYGAFGLGRAGAGQIFTPAMLLRGLAATVRGHLPGLPGGDTLLMPGAFLIAPSGRVVFAHYGTHVGDHAPADRLLAALGRS